jgi:hypothetical protein
MFASSSVMAPAARTTASYVRSLPPGQLIGQMSSLAELVTVTALSLVPGRGVQAGEGGTD